MKKNELQSPILRYIKKHWAVWLSLAITCVGAMVFLFFFHARYETNDDTTLAQIAHGSFSTYGGYNSHLVFINILWGRFIKLLLTVFPCVPWYALAQIVIVGVSFWVITWMMLRSLGVFFGGFSAALLWNLFGYQYFTCIQFSKTAGIAVTAGLLMVFLCFTEKRHWSQYVIGGALILLGSFYRFRVFEMLLALWFGVGVYYLLPILKERDGKKIKKLVGIFVLIIVLCFACEVVDGLLYARVPAWKEYVEYNNLRAELMDYGFPDYEENQALYESLGISAEDLNQYKMWEFGDPDRFTIDVMKQLVALRKSPEINASYIVHAFKELTKGLIQYSYAAGLWIAALFCLLSYRKKDRGKYLLVMYECMAFAGIQFFLFYQGRFLVNRIDVSIFLSAMVVLLFFARGSDGLGMNRRKLSLGIAGAVFFVSLPTYVSIYQRDKEQLQGESNTELTELITEDKVHLYISSPVSDGVPDIYYSIWNAPNPAEYSNIYYLGGWRTHSPLVDDVGAYYGIANPFRDSVNNPYTLFVSNSEWYMAKRLAYIQDHYDANATMACVKRTQDGYSIYRVVSEEKSLNTSEAADGTESLHYELNRWEQDGMLCMDGYLYADDVNSFASNIYVGIMAPDGSEQFYYAMQYYSGFTEDNWNGAYGSFSCEVPMPEEGSTLNLYLETEDGLYVVPN